MWGLHSEANRVCLTVKYFFSGSLCQTLNCCRYAPEHTSCWKAALCHWEEDRDSAKWMWTSERESYQHATFTNTLAITCYLDALRNICSYEPVTPALTFFFFFIFTFLALHMCSASKDSGSGVSSGCAGSFSFSRTLQVGRSWPSGKPGPLPASSVPVAALRSAAQLPHSCCRAESLHQLRASGWRCCTHNIANSSSWTPGASLLISFSLILQKCSRHIWNWRRLGTI